MAKQIVAFTSTGNHTWTAPNNLKDSKVEVLVVAGGGGGGGSAHGGGAGAGGLIYKSSHPVTPGATINLSVGAGGSGFQGEFSSPWPSPGTNKGTNGEDSVFDGLTAIGGGAGGGYSGGGSHDTPGQDGGSGGGGTDESAAGTGLQPTSTDGGSGNDGGTSTNNDYSKGGGGAGEKGGTNGLGHGGDGLYYGDIFGDEYGENGWFAGGGGGAIFTETSDTGGTGGTGGGGDGGSRHVSPYNPGDGLPNTGGGGGGAERSPSGDAKGGNGGSGIVLIAYEESPTPVIENLTLNNITFNSVDAQVEITDEGDTTVTSKGFVYSKTLEPDLNNSIIIENTSGNLIFSNTIDNLEAFQTYFIRGFATNSEGTSYTDTLNFKTLRRTIEFQEGVNVYGDSIEKNLKKISSKLMLTINPTIQIERNTNVVFKDFDGVTKFKGFVVDIDNNQTKEIEVNDELILLNRDYINKTYSNEKIVDIIKDIVETLTTLTFIDETGLEDTIEDITFNNVLGDEAIKRLMELFNGMICCNVNDEAILKRIGSTTNPNNLKEGRDRIEKGWNEEEEPFATKVTIKGAKVETNTIENLTGTNTEFFVSRKPKNPRVTVGGVELTQTIDGEIDGDYRVDTENKKFIFENSVTDPIIEYSYLGQIEATINANQEIISREGLKRNIVERPNITKQIDAIKEGREYIKRFSQKPLKAQFRKTDTIDIDKFNIGEKIQVIDEFRIPNVNRILTINKIKRVVGGNDSGLFIDVGSPETDVLDWNEETTRRVRQLEENETNSDFLLDSELLIDGLSVNISTQIKEFKERSKGDYFYWDDPVNGLWDNGNLWGGDQRDDWNDV